MVPKLNILCYLHSFEATTKKTRVATCMVTTMIYESQFVSSQKYGLITFID